MNISKILKEVDKNNLIKIDYLFTDIRFYMGKSVLQGVMGKAYADNTDNPKFAILIVRKYCFISGSLEKELLKEIMLNIFRDYKFIPSENLKKDIEEIFNNKIIIQQRYSFKKNTKFDVEKLKKFILNLDDIYEIKEIDEKLENQIKKEKFINITDNYKENGIGCCCIINNKIIGVASSNIFYKNGIEVNIKVSEEYRRKGIATSLASYLILMCIKRNKYISWDASNLNSVALAKKLGFEYIGPYKIYYFK